MSKYIEIKSDGRFKKGHIKKTGNKLRGNPETMKLVRLEGPFPVGLNPPIVVSDELGKAIKKHLGA